MRIKIGKLMMIFFAFCSLLVFNSVPVLASSSSAFPILLDPLVHDSRGWDNAWTETIFGNGTPPFKTIVYSSPQVMWNGTQWVKYEIKAINKTAVILRTPTCSYLVGKLVVSLLDPNGTSLHVGGMTWVVEQYSMALNKWVPKLVETASVGYNSTHVWQKWTFSDESDRVLYIDHNNKQTVTFTSKTSATYRVAWLFTYINATRIIHSNGTEVRLGKGSEFSLTDFNFTQLTLYNQNKFSLLINYNDIERSTFRNFILGRSETGLAYMNLIYGNWTIDSNEPITVDPTTETFNSEAELDGTIYKSGTSYPPTDIYMVGSGLQVGQQYGDNLFLIYRGYISFDTSSMRDYAIITGATLKLKTAHDESTHDFTMMVMSGSQPVYGSSLETADWNCGTTEVATWPSSQYPGDSIYINITIPTDQINKAGRTQFELKSDREGTPPTGAEYMDFYSGDFPGNEPKLEITWLASTKYIDGQWWYYWNSTTNKKAAIVLLGGYVLDGYWDRIYVCSLFYRKPPGYFTQNPWPYFKEGFIRDLHSNGFDILSPKNDTKGWETSVYAGTEDWVKNASMWLKEKGYQYIYLFGFSAGGVVAAYEIQKDYASIFSAAVIASAPVNWDEKSNYPIFQSAHTACKTKVRTSFIEAKGDPYHDQMWLYYDNMYYYDTIIHKEWHNWNNGTDPHDPFPDNCSDHPGETVFDATYNWYQHYWLTALAEDQYGNNLTTGYVYIDDQYCGRTGSNILVSAGTHKVLATDFWESGNTGNRYGFKNWTDGSTANPRNMTVVGDTTIRANFKKKWCPGDVDGDGKVTLADAAKVDLVFSGIITDPRWVRRCDVNGDGKVSIADVGIVDINYGNVYP